MIFNYNGNANKAGIYKITNTQTNKIYIGETHKFKKRWCEHKQHLLSGLVSSNQTKASKRFQNSFNFWYKKVGNDDFLVFDVIDVMPDNLTKEERLIQEEYRIQEFILDGKREELYNTKLFPTQEKEKTCWSYTPEETRKRLRESHLGIKPSQETIEKRRIALSGSNNSNYGKHPSLETRRKQSESHKGIPSGRKGKHPTEETRRKSSEAHKGQPAWNKGGYGPMTNKHHSEETKRKIGEANRGHVMSEEQKRQHSLALTGRKLSKEHIAKVVQKRKANHKPQTEKQKLAAKLANIKTYNIQLLSPEGAVYGPIVNMKQFCEEHSIGRTNVCKLINGKYKTCNGWKLLKNENRSSN